MDTATQTRPVMPAEGNETARQTPAVAAARTSAVGEAAHAVVAEARSKSLQYHVLPFATTSGAGRVKLVR